MAAAMRLGTPIVALSHGGVEAVLGYALDSERIEAVQPGSMDQTSRQLGEAMLSFVDNPPAECPPNLDQERAFEQLQGAFRRVLREGE